MYWIPKLHKSPYKSRFISASSKCSTTKISIMLTSDLTAVKELVINYWNKVYKYSNVNYFWSVKNSIEVLDKINSIDCPVTSVDSYDFSTLYTIPHKLIKEKCVYLINWSFKKSGSNFICCNDIKGFFSDQTYNNYCNWTCEDMIKALNFLLDNIYIRLGEKSLSSNHWNTYGGLTVPPSSQTCFYIAMNLSPWLNFIKTLPKPNF